MRSAPHRLSALCLGRSLPMQGQMGSTRGGARLGLPVLSLTFGILVSSSSYIRQLTLLLNELLFSILTTSGSRNAPQAWGHNDFSCCYSLRLLVPSLNFEVCNFSLSMSSASGLSSYVSSLTFLEPAKPSDSVKKYAKGIRKMRDRLEKRKTRFQRPRGKKEKQSWSLRGQSRWAT